MKPVVTRILSHDNLSAMKECSQRVRCRSHIFRALLTSAYSACAAARIRARIIRRQRLPGPVISIGNLTMGGTGKTPLVIYTARTLAKLGFEPAVLTRGYGRDEPNRMHIVSPGEYIHSPAAVLGDEPAVIRRHLPAILLGISPVPGRKEIGSVIPASSSPMTDSSISSSARSDIVLVDRSRPPASDRLIPRNAARNRSRQAGCGCWAVNACH